MSETYRQHRGLAMGGLVFAVLFWAVNTVVAKGVVNDIPPLSLAFFRWITAMVFLYPFAHKGLISERNAIRENIRPLFLLSLPSVAMYNVLLYLGALYTTATNMSLVTAAMPAVTLGTAWMLTRVRPGPVQTAGISLAMAGVVVIVAKGDWTTLAGLNLNPGDLLMLGAIVSWAVYSVFLKQTVLPVSAIPFLFMTMVLGTLSIFPFYLWELAVKGGFEVNASVIWMFVYLGICPSILSFIFWNHGVRVLGASLASVSVYLIPVFASVLACIFLGEQLFAYHFLGGILILLGLIFSSRDR